LLLDEMLGDRIATELCARGHDVVAVVADPELVSLSDDRLLAQATKLGRALVTMNVKDFLTLDTQYRSLGQDHAGLVAVPSRAFPPTSGRVGSLVRSLHALLEQPGSVGPGRVVFLKPASRNR
jgi:hypothetical protein